MPFWALWAVCFLALAMRALVAAAESALYLTSDLRAKQLARDFPRAGRRVVRHKTEREVTAAALRLGMVLSGFLGAAMGTLALPARIAQHLALDNSWAWILPPAISAVVVGIGAATLDVAFRAVAYASPERWALRLSIVVSMLVYLLYPVMTVVLAVLNVFATPFGRRVRFEAPPPPLEELEKLLTAQAANHEVDQAAPQLIRSIFELSDKRCRDVMVPRTAVIAVDVTTPPEEILRILAEENHSRIPVYRDDIDHVVGVLHARDLIPLLQHPELIVLADVIRPAHFVPWVKPIGDLLREMQRGRIHMAMVVDEHGGFMGVVTLEDILREIVGDIGDEFEEVEKAFEKQSDGSFIVDATMSVEDFAQAFGFNLPEGEYETLGGFLSSLAGSIPEVGERFAFNGWNFGVASKSGAKLDKVRLIRARASAPSPGTSPQPSTPAATVQGVGRA
ncbi:MAG: hemolysin family protein [Myxococcaceae bacterium]